MMDINNYDIQAIEREIILNYEDSTGDYTNLKYLLSLRKELINRRVLAHQEEILPDIIAFNDALTEALRQMYDKAQRIWNSIKDNKDFSEETRLIAKCFLGYDYPELHPVQGEDRQDLWYALCDSGWNPLYENGVTLPVLTLPNERESFESLIGMDCPPPNWNEGLDRELTKDLNLTSAFHNLFEHMEFAITDFIYVRNFETEIIIEDNAFLLK